VLSTYDYGGRPPFYILGCMIIYIWVGNLRVISLKCLEASIAYSGMCACHQGAPLLDEMILVFADFGF
jgi:hypothetical protein